MHSGRMDILLRFKKGNFKICMTFLMFCLDFYFSLGINIPFGCFLFWGHTQRYSVFTPGSAFRDVVQRWNKCKTSTLTFVYLQAPKTLPTVQLLWPQISFLIVKDGNNKKQLRYIIIYAFITWFLEFDKLNDQCHINVLIIWAFNVAGQRNLSWSLWI